MSAFAGMWIQPADDDLGCGDTESFAEVVEQDAKYLAQPVARDSVRDLPQRQVCRRERNTQVARGQQHHRQRRATALGQELGVAPERNACLVDDALVQRRGDQRPIAALHAAGNSVPQASEQRLRVRGIGLAAGRHARKSKGNDQQLAGRAGAIYGPFEPDLTDRDIEPELTRTRFQQFGVRDDH
jgi:hypothetical protein